MKRLNENGLDEIITRTIKSVLSEDVDMGQSDRPLWEKPKRTDSLKNQKIRQQISQLRRRLDDLDEFGKDYNLFRQIQRKIDLLKKELD